MVNHLAANERRVHVKGDQPAPRALALGAGQREIDTPALRQASNLRMQSARARRIVEVQFEGQLCAAWGTQPAQTAQFEVALRERRQQVRRESGARRHDQS